MAASIGPIGRLGRYTATHFRLVFAAWVLIALALGLLAPRVETALSGAGWHATGSQSVQARGLIDRHFAGAGSYALHVGRPLAGSRGDRARVPPGDGRCAADSAGRPRRRPARRRLDAGVSISRDGHTAVIQAGAAADPNAMVAAADRLEAKLPDVAGSDVAVNLTGASGMWSDFNQANREAMLKSELISWPVTWRSWSGLRLARRRRPAADADDHRPDRLRGPALPRTLVSPISIWAMNFALMFALALGHRLRPVRRASASAAPSSARRSPRRGGRRGRWTRPARPCSSRD